MDIVHMIVVYNDERRLLDAVEYIKEYPSKFKVKDLNKALKWAGKNPKDYKGKYNKMEAIIDFIKYEYMK